MRLEAAAVDFGYPERPVGRGASLNVAAGEIVCLLGPNGCGKTTLFKTLLGLIPAQGGEVRIDEIPLAGLSRAEIARRMAYVPQAQAGTFPYSVLDLVTMGRVAHRGLFAGPSAEDRRIAREALDELGIGELAERDATRLSGGQRQLVVIARAVAQRAPLIVMDEPTAALDFGNQVRVLGEIRRLRERGAGIVLSTHDPDHALAIASRVVVMRDGAIVASGAPAEVLTAERLEAVYGVAVTVERLASGALVCQPDYGAQRSA